MANPRERDADRFCQPGGSHYYADRTDGGAVGASHYYADKVEPDTADAPARSDDEIKNLVSEAMLDATGITVEVNDGEVILGGSVDDPRIERVAEARARAVRGVRDVHNHIGKGA
jgi:BON domain